MDEYTLVHNSYRVLPCMLYNNKQYDMCEKIILHRYIDSFCLKISKTSASGIGNKKLYKIIKKYKVT